jgi:hypothetical protein
MRRRVVVFLFSLALCAALPGGSALAAPPPNDAFADAPVLAAPGPTGVVSVDGTTDEATLETGEELWGGHDKSVWYSVTPAEDMVIGLSVCMEEGDWTNVRPGTGGSVDSLTVLPVTRGVNVPSDCRSYGTYRFDATAGVTYRLRVASAGNDTGPFRLYLQRDRNTPAANDAFSAAEPIPEPGPTGEVSVNGDNRRATTEPGEPQTDQLHLPPSGASVWYALEATETAPVVLTTCGNPELNTVLSVYTGPSVDDLTEVTSNANTESCPDPNASEVGLLAEQGTTYHVRVAGVHLGMTPDEGRFTLRAFRGVARPSVERLFSPMTWSSGEIPAVNPSIDPIEFALAGAKSATFRCSLDGAPPSPCPASHGYPAELFAHGTTHTLSVTAAIGGYESEPTLSEWGIDLSAPDTTITAGPPEGSAAPLSFQWTLQSSETAGLICTIDGIDVSGGPGCGPDSLQAGPRDWTAPAELCNAAHAFEFSAIDNARNVDPTPARRTVTTTGGQECAKPDLGPVDLDYLDATSAYLHAIIDGHGAATTFHVEYGTTTAYGTSTAETDFGLGQDDVYAEIGFLEPETNYHARIVARNPSGQTVSNDIEFTTSPASGTAPTASLDTPTDVTHSSVRLRGEVSSPDGYYFQTRFEYGTTAAYGHVTQARLHDLGTSAGVLETVTGLQPNTTYHYRLVVSIETNRGVSEDRMFTTAPAPVHDPTDPPGGGTPAPGPTHPGPTDSQAPGFKTSGLKAVKLGRNRTAAFWLTTNEDATGTFGGSVSVPGNAGHAIPFVHKTLELKAGKRTKVALKLSRKNAARVRKALGRKNLSAKVTVTLRDANGNRTTRRLTVKLRRR